MEKSPQRVICLYVAESLQKQREQELKVASELGLRIQFVDKEKLSKLCGSGQHQGIAIEALPRAMQKEDDLQQIIAAKLDQAQLPLVLVLDQVQDPHNLGACLRTADAAGADAVVIPKDKSCGITPVVNKVASGALETVNLVSVTNLARTLESLKEQGLWVIGTSDKAKQSLYEQDFSMPVALVMGAEGTGIRRLTEQSCDSLIHIPMSGSIVSSLNVSVATGVCLYEVVRSRAAS
jgi:23S rRNA (guanosine2251-2'-O)-methyltransferase